MYIVLVALFFVASALTATALCDLAYICEDEDEDYDYE